MTDKKAEEPKVEPAKDEKQDDKKSVVTMKRGDYMIHV
jgi:hypothetical protein